MADMTAIVPASANTPLKRLQHFERVIEKLPASPDAISAEDERGDRFMAIKAAARALKDDSAVMKGIDTVTAFRLQSELEASK